MLQLSEAFLLLLRRLQTEVGSWESLVGRWMGVGMTMALPAAGKVLKGILNPFSIFSPHLFFFVFVFFLFVGMDEVGWRAGQRREGRAIKVGRGEYLAHYMSMGSLRVGHD